VSELQMPENASFVNIQQRQQPQTKFYEEFSSMLMLKDNENVVEQSTAF
jgi:hypothetical protein